MILSEALKCKRPIRRQAWDIDEWCHPNVLFTEDIERYPYLERVLAEMPCKLLHPYDVGGEDWILLVEDDSSFAACQAVLNSLEWEENKWRPHVKELYKRIEEQDKELKLLLTAFRKLAGIEE
jgi:hypothetical protein